MPSDPVSEQLLGKVAARLAALAAGATYHFTAGEVLREFKKAEEVKAFPYYGVIAGPEKRPQGSYKQVACVLTVYIIGWVNEDKQGAGRQTLVQRAKGDVITAIFQGETWDGLALATRVIETAPDSAPLTSKPYGYFELEAEISYYLDGTAA